MTTESPNLDAMEQAELWSFWQKHQGHSRKLAAELFGRTGKGTVTAMQNLACYASNKATAMKLRAEGNIQTAQQYEAICERIYSRLPEFARW